MFELKGSTVSGCHELMTDVRHDPRGRFVKTFHADFFEARGMATVFREQYYSVSQRGVLRGLHFQVPPFDHHKLVFCTSGRIVDAVVDIRRGSPTFGRHAVFELSAELANQIYVPRGCAHGFYVTSEEATVVYNVTTVYAPDHDAGILWSSAGIVWPDRNPVLSERDAEFPPLSDFDSPFLFDDSSRVLSDSGPQAWQSR